MKISNLNNLSHQQLTSSKTGEVYSKSAVLTDLFGFKDIFIHHEILAPGRKTSIPHSHAKQEEMVVVLSGSPSCHYGKEVTQMKTGDFIGFKPGDLELHCIENLTDEVVHLLVICSRQQDDLILAEG